MDGLGMAKVLMLVEEVQRLRLEHQLLLDTCRAVESFTEDAPGEARLSTATIRRLIGEPRG